MNGINVASPTQIRYGEITEDEFFVTYDAARNGVNIENQRNHRYSLLLPKKRPPGAYNGALVPPAVSRTLGRG
jgi:hypothetical protein